MLKSVRMMNAAKEKSGVPWSITGGCGQSLGGRVELAAPKHRWFLLTGLMTV